MRTSSSTRSTVPAHTLCHTLHHTFSGRLIKYFLSRIPPPTLANLTRLARFCWMRQTRLCVTQGRLPCHKACSGSSMSLASCGGRGGRAAGGSGGRMGVKRELLVSPRRQKIRSARVACCACRPVDRTTYQAAAHAPHPLRPAAPPSEPRQPCASTS